jgi:Ni/Fe-hydrogenase subunit HybB-like protein
LAALLFFLLAARFIDTLTRELPIVTLKNDVVSLLFGLEITMLFVPMWILGTARGAAQPGTIYYSAIMVLAGIITNRLNFCITSTEAATGVRYLPNWTEFLLAYSIVALAIAALSAGAKRVSMFSAMEIAKVR